MTNFFQNIKEGENYKYFFDGEWRKNKSGEMIEIKSPIDGSLVGRVPALSKDEVDKVFYSTKEAQKKWAKFPLEDRAAILKKAADLLRSLVDDFVEIKVLELGKTRASARSSILRSADVMSYTADQIGLVNKKEILYSKDFPGAGDKKSALVSREPYGVVVAISPFNYPVNLGIAKIVPALFAGNSVVVKGPTQGSISTAMMVEVLNKAGVPKGVIGFVTGRGSEIGDSIITNKYADLINFTGSTEVGKGLAKKVGFKPLILEMGGKDAALVLPDADLGKTAMAICDGAFSYAGQRCTAIKRVLVDKTVHAQFLEKLIEITKQKYSLVGDPRRDEVQMGPIISEKQVDYIQELIFDAVESGAKIVLGGVRKLNYLEATIIDGVNKDMRIAWEEQFGPVLPIITCDSIEEMISLHNQSQYGLGASIFSQDIGQAQELTEKLEAGVVQINGKSERYPDNFPFLGIKDSGLGVQGVRWSIESMTRLKSVVSND